MKHLNTPTKIVLAIFLIWLGYCAYSFSQNGRYRVVNSFLLDTFNGNIHDPITRKKIN